MTLWTIYDHPRDHPEHFVVRGWDIAMGTSGPVAVPRARQTLFTTLDAARAAMGGRACLGRSDGDDACIVETWA